MQNEKSNDKILKTIGRKDKIDLPDLGLMEIEAKIDTGAFGCALHCHHVELVEVNGKKELHFKLLDPSHPEYEDKLLISTKFGLKHVKSSNGVKEERFTIRTSIRIFNTTYLMRFSLADRQQMKYPILLGRTFLKKRFIVDVSKKDISFKSYIS